MAYLGTSGVPFHRNRPGRSQTALVTGLHAAAHTFELAPHAGREVNVASLENNHGWYDVMGSVEDPVYARQFAGHVENGEPSRTSSN